ncbi:VirB4-like conjugal transfer ATPase, CD1110 family [Butyribacter intestini]|uniref:TraG P-loop domain-containing protein n=1 Tax=Butyribacter intestini TaxID=1703332 RepID=A0AAW3JUS9_9FIRM|nr:hypothetical protein APZ18_03810 [Butyribacter intestini]RHU77430.1 hypothetical protein DXC30_03885 [Butyribacter intestini]
MGLFTDGFKLLKKASEPLYKTPKSIQETIEIMAVAENGIFEVSKNKYSKCYRFQDINYTTATEDEQIGIFERYCKFLNSLDCNYKITINNKNKNMDELRDKVLIAEKNDGFNNYRSIYNDIIEEKIIEGRQGIEQERYLTITIERKNFEEAKAQFATLEATIHKAFIELGAEIVPLNGNERLKVLYDYYHLGDEGSFDFDIKKAKKVGADFRNDLCNGMVKYFPDHFEDESKFCKALFIKKYPSSLSDRFINEITSLPVHSITSIDVVPVPKDLTTKVLQKKYLGIESDIIKQQRVRNKNNDFSTEISYAKRTEKKEIEEIMDDVRENDQCLFFVGVTIILMAESKKELESVCETVETIGKRNSCTIDTHYLKQREALNTALPIGVRQVETMRTLLTQSLAVLMPFNVQELNDSTGNYYGINQISKNGKRGKATWLYIDEFHVLLNSEYSAKYLQQLWKKVRKQGGLCTGITQNVVDLLQNYTATTMLANSEFVALLKQANTDSSKMAEVIGVSEAQLRFVTNTASGMGLIKCGSVVIPFDNQISKDTDLYRLYNTNIHEKIAEQKKREMQKNVE